MQHRLHDILDLAPTPGDVTGDPLDAPLAPAASGPVRRPRGAGSQLVTGG